MLHTPNLKILPRIYCCIGPLDPAFCRHLIFLDFVGSFYLRCSGYPLAAWPHKNAATSRSKYTSLFKITTLVCYVPRRLVLS